MTDTQSSGSIQASPESLRPAQDMPSGEVLRGLKTEELEASRVEEREEIMNIPKAAELYKGDINAAVIQVQKTTGIEITPAWWAEHVQYDADNSTETVLARFDAAYAEFVASQQ